jgi:hypothetical protein
MRYIAAHQQGFPSEKERIAVKDISVVDIIDPYAFVSGSKIIAVLKIKGTCGVQMRKLFKTPKGGYVLM